MKSWSAKIDRISAQAAVPLLRFSLFLIYAWFGLLKVIGESPATPLVHHLHDRLINFIPFDTFNVVFGLIEIGIGLLFLIRGWERIALLVLLGHMVATTLPLAVLPGDVWVKFGVPTLEGQYIIKNAALIAAAFSLVALARSRRSPG